MAAATNNLALCCLYLRKISTAVERLESLVCRQPGRFLVDAVVFNLCTMYDLSCAPEMSTIKKKGVQQLASAYHVEDLHWRSFRLS